MRQLGLGHFTFLDQSPIDLVRLARTAGFDFVGLRFHPVAPGQLHWLPDAAGLKRLGRAMQDEGIGLYDIETVVIDAQLDPETLIPAMDAAQVLGAQRINTCADVFSGLTRTFARICTLAAERGLGVDLECMAWRGVNTPQACLDLIVQSGASNAGYLVDTLHHSRCGGTPADIADMATGRIVSAQLCDAPRAHPEERDALIAEARGGRLMPGQGSLPLSQILAALPKGTVLSVEVPSATDTRPPRERAREIYIRTKALLDEEAT